MTAMRILGGMDASGRGISLGIENGLQGAATTQAPYLDATGLTVVPGFVDIQINGAFGSDFTENPETIWDVGARLPETGVTAFCPTIITSPDGSIQAAQAAMGLRPKGYVGAEPVGLHIEGPFLSREKRGTHPEDLLRNPGDVPLTPEHVSIVTIAPELPGAIELIADLTSQGIVASVGHSAATGDMTRAALDAGATLGTHLFNAMPPLTAREPGVAGVLLADPRAYFGVIVDGHHLDPATLRLSWNAAPDRFCIITDAIAAAGQSDGSYRIGSVEVEKRNDVVRNADGTLAGAAVTMDRELAILMAATEAPLDEAVAAVTFNPSEAIGSWDRGRLRRGTRGDITLLDGQDVAATIVGGRIAFLRDRGRWKEPTNAAS
ncbi:MAG: N-acetylglucosamine-6-phosphate deacetylase [Acidimicrobiia bacterium]